MADRTDFNDMGGDVAGQVNSAKTLEQERKKALRAAKNPVSKLNGRDPGAWFEEKALDALAFLLAESKPDYERAIFAARKAKVGLRDLKSEMQKRARKFVFDSPYSKNGGTRGTRGTASDDEAFAVPPEKDGGGTRGTEGGDAPPWFYFLMRAAGHATGCMTMTSPWARV